MEFEWDPEKASENLSKHKISFEACLSLFADPSRLESDSSKPEHGEIRQKTIGRLESGVVIVVVSTDRGNATRIISARKASRHERRAYDKGATAS
jgi:uncharacterized protein